MAPVFTAACCRLLSLDHSHTLIPFLNPRTVRALTTTHATTTAAAQQWQERGRRGRGRWRGDGGRQPRVRGGAVRGRARVSHRLPQRWQVLPSLQADGHQVGGRRVRVHHAHGHPGEPVPQGVQDPVVGPSWDHRGGGVREGERAAGTEEDDIVVAARVVGCRVRGVSMCGTRCVCVTFTLVLALALCQPPHHLSLRISLPPAPPLLLSSSTRSSPVRRRVT